MLGIFAIFAQTVQDKRKVYQSTVTWLNAQNKP